MINGKTLGLKCLRVEGDSKVFHVQLPSTVDNKDVQMIATLAMLLELGQASISLDEINGRLAILLTISDEDFPLRLAGENKNGGGAE